MVQLYENIGHIVVMSVLLLGSAFFSGAETAFFNLSRRQINLLQKSGQGVQNLAARLLDRPSELLNCLLFGNMTVNVLFYAAASVVALRVSQQVGITAAAVTGAVAFCILVLFGEILPKSLAYANSRSVSVIAAVPLVLLLRVFAPLQFVFRFLITEPVLRLLLGGKKTRAAITVTEFKSLIERVRKRGLITADENRLLTEVIELGFLKVRHVMQPRVDMTACAVTDSAATAREMMLRHGLTKLPVYVGAIDNIIGVVGLRQLLLRPNTSLDKLVQRVRFVPEQKTVESLLEFFRSSHTDTAIVVDEYGGIAGSVRLEDIAEELLGPIEAAEARESIEQIGPLKYRLAGDLAIHDWAESFGIAGEQRRFSTVAGLVMAALGRIPNAGDVAYFKNLKFTVERMRKHRIETIILTLEQMATDE